MPQVDRHEPFAGKLQQIESVFNHALALPEGDRAKLVELRCEGDAELVAEVSSLLRACAEEEIMAAARLQALPRDGHCGEERKRVGAYEIDRSIGRGGMGAVYVAHRADGNFEQQVAVKLIDLALATDLFRERFRLERQILAGLNHPWIRGQPKRETAMRTTRFTQILAVLFLGIGIALGATAQQSSLSEESAENQMIPLRVIDRVVDYVDDARLVRLAGQVHPMARPEFDMGRVDSNKLLQRVVMVLKRSPEQEAALSAFNERQYDPNSPDFHHWLSA